MCFVVKVVFDTAIKNDSLFLSKINVVDYSIVVGLDDESKELVRSSINGYAFIRFRDTFRVGSKWLIMGKCTKINVSFDLT